MNENDLQQRKTFLEEAEALCSRIAMLKHGVNDIRLFLGNDLRFHGSTNGPTIKLAEMTIGGTAAAEGGVRG